MAPLLQDIGAHVDPLEVVKRIPRGMRIEGLREKLVKIISDYHLHMSAPAPVPPQRDTFACHDSIQDLCFMTAIMQTRPHVSNRLLPPPGLTARASLVQVAARGVRKDPAVGRGRALAQGQQDAAPRRPRRRRLPLRSSPNRSAPPPLLSSTWRLRARAVGGGRCSDGRRAAQGSRGRRWCGVRTTSCSRPTPTWLSSWAAGRSRRRRWCPCAWPRSARRPRAPRCAKMAAWLARLACRARRRRRRRGRRRSRRGAAGAGARVPRAGRQDRWARRRSARRGAVSAARHGAAS